jgi:uncharacterized repeat protein (TIGR01451 family)
MQVKKINTNLFLGILIIFLVVSFITPSVVHAATAPSLGSESTYGVVSSTHTNSNTASQTIINGDICATTHDVPLPLTIVGATDTPCAPLKGTDQSAALAILNGQVCTPISGTLNTVIVGGNAPGTFPPGCYEVTGAMDITTGTTVTLDATAPGGSGSVWIFRSSGGLTTGASTAGFPSVALANGADADNVFWAPAGATTLGANFAASATPTFVGSILDAAGISIGHFTNLLGRALAFGGTVLTDANTIAVPTATPLANLQVIKTVINDNGGIATASSFNLHVKLGGVDVAGSPAVGVVTPGRLYALTPAAYVVSEDLNASYAKSFSGDCDALGNVTLAPGDSKTCTITNDDVAIIPPQLTVTKVVVNNNGGTKVISDFPLFIDGGGVTSGVANATTVGLHTVSETADLGYANTITGDCALDGTITLAPGDALTCIITNDDIAPQLIVNKIIVGGVGVISDFPLFIDGGGVTSGVTNTTTVGLHTVSETSGSDYAATIGGHCASNGTITLALGELKICTITNNALGSASSTITITTAPPPLIDVVKVPSPLALPTGPGLVEYTYTLRNIGIVPVNNITMVGDSCSPIVLTSGDNNKNSILEVNEVWKYNCATKLSVTHTNIVTATGWANGISAVDIASATVVVGLPLVPPLIHVTKIPNPLILPALGGMVTYTGQVTNLGTIPLSNVRLNDDKCSPVNYISGDTNNNSKLDTTETWVYTCQSNLDRTTTNTITAIADANGLTATDFAIATVVVSAPGLPKTGFPSEDKKSLYAIIFIGALALIYGIFVVLRKRKI